MDKVQADFVALVEVCSTWHGQRLRISEALSTNGLNFDRHSTTRCQLEFTLTRSFCRLSGGRLTLDGDTHSYEVGADQLVGLTWHSPTRVEFLEHYAASVFRQTIIHLL